MAQSNRKFPYKKWHVFSFLGEEVTENNNPSAFEQIGHFLLKNSIEFYLQNPVLIEISISYVKVAFVAQSSRIFPYKRWPIFWSISYVKVVFMAQSWLQDTNPPFSQKTYHFL